MVNPQLSQRGRINCSIFTGGVDTGPVPPEEGRLRQFDKGVGRRVG